MALASMDMPEHLSVEDQYCRYCPLGPYTLTEAVELLSHAIAWCHEHRMPRLLADVTRIYGFPVPTLIDRFWMAQDWAQAAGSTVTVSIVAHAHYIDPGKFGMRAARDAGLHCDIFPVEEDAVAWLISQT